MRVVADLHIHSKYSGATSKNSDLEGLSEWAKIKGITLQATGDFTHPLWFKELKEKLKPGEDGLYTFSDQRFILSVEVSIIFPLKEKTRKMHVVILTPYLETAEQINEKLSKYGDLRADARPTLLMSGEELIDEVKGVDKRNELIPAHIWTPWFSLFGSKFGVNSIEEAFGERSKEILALETGLSSDPLMNWAVSSLNKYALVSNSDSHSPKNLGREANVFEIEEISYDALINAIRTRKGFVKTYEFYPQEGKYHYDGHRKCNISLSPEEAEKFRNKCPVCRKPLTLGVLHRVYELADKKIGYKPENAVGFQHIVPLPKLIAKVLKRGETTKKVWEEYFRLVRYFGSEFNVYEASYDELLLATNKEMADAIYKVNTGEIKWKPGYDGIFGDFSLEKGEEKIEERDSIDKYF